MAITVKKVSQILEDLAPKTYAESFDNVGLLVGNENQEVTGVLITLDCIEEVVDEAIAKNLNMIVAFHPIIFSGLKKITGKSYVERTVLKAIQHNIAIYALHTNLDFAFNGSNWKLGEILHLQNIKTLIPKDKTIKKLTTYVPTVDMEKVRQALFENGAGNIGNYENCSFTVEGIGTYKGNDDSNPVIGERGVFHKEPETCVSLTFPWYLESKLVQTLKEAHPYEEVAYEIVTLDNENQHIGIGVYGDLSEALSETDFLAFIKTKIPTACIRHSNLLGKKIQKVALLGGSGSFGLNAAKAVRADAYISADFKYHEFYQAENQILICDVGHFECEQHIKTLLFDYLTKKITNFAVALSEVNTNPVNYY